MPISIETTRPLSPLEQRYLAMAMGDFRCLRRESIWKVAGLYAVLFAIFAGVFLHEKPSAFRNIFLGGTFLAIGAYTVRSTPKLFEPMTENMHEIESTIRANTVKEIAIRSDAAAEIAVSEREDSLFALQTEEDLIVVIRDLIETPRFPNDDFSIVELLDEKGETQYRLVKSRGRKLRNIRRIPESTARNMKLPSGQMETFKGRLEDLEAVLV